jgi:hypothetical protein
MILCMMVVISYLVLWDLVPLSVVKQFTRDFIVAFMTFVCIGLNFNLHERLAVQLSPAWLILSHHISVFSAPALQSGRNTVYHDL